MNIDQIYIELKKFPSYQGYGNILINGDCLEVMKDIPGKSIDMILCDLPYGTTSCSWDTIIPFEPLWEQYERIIKPKGNIILFGSEPFSSLLRISNIDWYKYDWVWEKNNAGNFQLVNYQPLKIHENISVFINDSPNLQFSIIMKENMKRLRLKNIDLAKLELSKNGGITGWVTNKLNGTQLPTKIQWSKICNLFGIPDEYEKIMDTIVYPTYNLNLDNIDIELSNKNKGGKLGHLSSEKKRDKYKQTKTGYPKSILKYNRDVGLHPTQKPLDLIKFLVSVYSNPNDIVLDNCMGSNTTGVACSILGRNYIGIEKGKKYFDVSVERVKLLNKGIF